MSKRKSTSDGLNPAKRDRKKAGFRVARSNSTSTKPQKSVFVTVTHPDEQRGTLIGQTRVLSNTPDPPQLPSSSGAHSDIPEPRPTPENEDFPILPESLPPEEVPPAKGKRKRHTKNVVCYLCNSYIYDICNSTFRIDLPSGLNFVQRFWMRPYGTMGLEIFWVTQIVRGAQRPWEYSSV